MSKVRVEHQADLVLNFCPGHRIGLPKEKSTAGRISFRHPGAKPCFYGIKKLGFVGDKTNSRRLTKKELLA